MRGSAGVPLPLLLLPFVLVPFALPFDGSVCAPMYCWRRDAGMRPRKMRRELPLLPVCVSESGICSSPGMGAAPVACIQPGCRAGDVAAEAVARIVAVVDAGAPAVTGIHAYSVHVAAS